MIWARWIHRFVLSLAWASSILLLDSDLLSAADVPQWMPHDVAFQASPPAGELNNGAEKRTPPKNWGDAPLVLHVRAGQRLRADAP